MQDKGLHTILTVGAIPASRAHSRTFTILLGTCIAITAVALLTTIVSKKTIIAFCMQKHSKKTA